MTKAKDTHTPPTTPRAYRSDPMPGTATDYFKQAAEYLDAVKAAQSSGIVRRHPRKAHPIDILTETWREIDAMRAGRETDSEPAPVMTTRAILRAASVVDLATFRRAWV